MPNIGEIVKIKGKDCIVIDFHGMRCAVPVDVVKRIQSNQ